MASLCVPGLQGFPIQLTGFDINKLLISQNDISLQFSPSKVPITATGDGFYNINGENTFFIGGSQYFVKAIRIRDPMQTGLFSITPIAEFQIWGYPTTTSNDNKSLAILTIPIFQGAVNTTAGDNLVKWLKGDSITFQNLIPSGEDIDIIRYSTCIETDKNYTINIKVGYWQKGLTITQDMVKLLPTPLSKVGVPKMDNYKFLSTFEQSVSGKGNRVFNENKNLLEPYSTSLSATSVDVKNVFKYIRGFTSQKTDKFSTDLYKCVSIDKSRDIKDGKLLIDPSNGKRLSDSMEDANSAEAKLELQEIKYSPKRFVTYIAIILGSILAIGLLILGGYLLYRLINSSGQIVGAATASPTVATGLVSKPVPGPLKPV